MKHTHHAYLLTIITFLISNFVQSMEIKLIQEWEKNREHDGVVTSIAISPDRKFIASKSSYGSNKIRIHATDDLDSIYSEKTISDEYSNCLTFIDDQTLAWQDDKQVKLWNHGTKEIDYLDLNGYYLYDIAVKPIFNTLLIAIGSDADTISIWDLLTKKHLHSLQLPRGEDPSYLTFNNDPDKPLLISGTHKIVFDEAGYIYLWDPFTGENIKTITPSFPIFSLTSLPDSETIVFTQGSANNYGSCEQYTPSTDTLKKLTLVERESHHTYGQGQRVEVISELSAVQHQGETIVFGVDIKGHRSILKMWNITSGENHDIELPTSYGAIETVLASSENNELTIFILSGTTIKKIKLVDVKEITQ